MSRPESGAGVGVATVDPAVAKETAPAHRAPGRPRSAQANRAIIDAIVDVLVNQGYREVTIEAVAARAGVAKTTPVGWRPSS